jgi:HPt (histidine-containing phosphotransfer) domain-containing protein
MVSDPELDELKREFLAEARDKAAEIESALGAPDDRQSVERVGYLAHQLKGAGGSYGYESISDEAAAIEKMAEQLGADGVEAEVRQHVARLRAEIEQRAKELG